MLTAPYHPASNGAAESAVKVCKQAIKKAIKQNLNIDVALNRFLLAYRNAEHSTTGLSPAFILQGRSLRMRLDCLKPDRSDRVRNSQLRQEKGAGGVVREMRVGDPVWFRLYRNGSDKWLPGKILCRVGDTDYSIQLPNGTEVHRHIDQLRLRRMIPESDREYPTAIQSRAFCSSLVLPGGDAGGSSGRGDSGDSVGPGAGNQASGPAAAFTVAGGAAGHGNQQVGANTSSQIPIELTHSPTMESGETFVRDPYPRRERRPPVRYGFEID